MPGFLNDAYMKNKFNVKDTVFYRNGHFGIKKCTVENISQAVTKDEPFYEISWPPTGRTYVFENEIFATQEELENALKQ